VHFATAMYSKLTVQKLPISAKREQVIQPVTWHNISERCRWISYL